MRETIIISPFSRILRSGGVNPKNYPHWKELVKMLQEKGYTIVQIGSQGEELIGADKVSFELGLSELKRRLRSCYTWYSVDNMFQHLAWYEGKKGIAIFGQSDPIIFGHNTNINLLKGREFLRPLQFDIWERAELRQDCWVTPEQALEAIKQL